MGEEQLTPELELNQRRRELAVANAGMAREASRHVLLQWAPWLVAMLVVGIGWTWLAPNILHLGLGRTISAAGLSVDIVGVYMLARGVLISSEEIEGSALAAGLDQRKQLYRNRAEGWIGVLVVGLGFLLQLIGNLL